MTTSVPTYDSRLEEVRFCWACGHACGNTIAAKYLAYHGVGHAPDSSVRLGRYPFEDGDPEPVIMFAFRRDFDDEPVALEIVPLGTNAPFFRKPRSRVILGNPHGAAFMLRRQTSPLLLTVGALEALAKFDPQNRCCWAAASHSLLEHVPLRSNRRGWTLRLLSAAPPSFDAAKRWKNLGANVEWLAHDDASNREAC